MKIHDDFILKEVAGNFLVVPTGEKMLDFSSMVTINETGAFLWEQLKTGASLEELESLIIKEYDIDSDTARNDINEFVNTLRANKIIE